MPLDVVFEPIRAPVSHLLHENELFSVPDEASLYLYLLTSKVTLAEDLRIIAYFNDPGEGVSSSQKKNSKLLFLRKKKTNHFRIQTSKTWNFTPKINHPSGVWHTLKYAMLCTQYTRMLQSCSSNVVVWFLTEPRVRNKAIKKKHPTLNRY